VAFHPNFTNLEASRAEALERAPPHFRVAVKPPVREAFWLFDISQFLKATGNRSYVTVEK